MMIFGLFNKRKKDKALTWPMKLSDSIDSVFSHNDIISLWIQNPKEPKGSYICFYQDKMAWSIPQQYREAKLIKIIGFVPESIIHADTINLLVDPDSGELYDQLYRELKLYE